MIEANGNPVRKVILGINNIMVLDIRVKVKEVILVGTGIFNVDDVKIDWILNPEEVEQTKLPPIKHQIGVVRSQV